jgi:hypothetical protein
VDEQQHASIPLGRVRAGELRWEKFLYELKAGLRAAASGGRPRPTYPTPSVESPDLSWPLILMVDRTMLR